MSSKRTKTIKCPVCGHKNKVDFDLTLELCSACQASLDPAHNLTVVGPNAPEPPRKQFVPVPRTRVTASWVVAVIAAMLVIAFVAAVRSAGFTRIGPGHPQAALPPDNPVAAAPNRQPDPVPPPEVRAAPPTPIANSRPANENKPVVRPPQPPAGASQWPAAVATELTGDTRVIIVNPSSAAVDLAFRRNGQGCNQRIPGQSQLSVYLPEGDYQVWYRTTTNPDAVVYGGSITFGKVDRKYTLFQSAPPP
jgi:hypothetical protein